MHYVRTTIKATMIAMKTTPPTPPAMIPTSVPVLSALEAVGVDVCMVASWEEVLELVVVMEVVLEAGGGVVVEVVVELED
jgi:hypothetical protein